MRIAIFEPLDDHTATVVLDGNVLYRPDVAKKGNRDLSRAVFDNDIQAVIAKDWFFREAFFNECKARNWDLTIVLTNNHQPTNAQQEMARQAGITLISSVGQDGLSCFVSGLCALERRAKQDLVPSSIYYPSSSKSVTFVGCGVVNLISAHLVASKGYEVSMIDAKPDPRSRPTWDKLGCSSGGGNARMFTLSEMDNYNCRTIHEDMNNLFSKDIVNLGWNIFGDAGLNEQELNWIDEFQSVPVWLADQFNEDIFAFNAESWEYWQAWIEADPALFSGSLYTNKILRIYADRAHYETAVARQNRIDATIKVVTAEEVAIAQPGLKDAVANGQIAGGVYVHGFTINVHDFIDGLINRLESLGVTFQWDTLVTDLSYNAQGQVTHLALGDTNLDVDNLVISPGSYAAGLLKKTACNDKICGVLGAWLTLPCTETYLVNSLKLARKGHIVEDSNVTISTDENGNPAIIIGSGYGFTGFDPTNIDKNLLEKMYDGVIDTARQYFPDLYKALVDQGTLRDSLKYCVRPWTSTSLGLFEIHEAVQQNKCIVTGGHNTGGFAQATSIATAVFAALEGKPHQMHYDYQPNRFTQFQMPPNRRADARFVA